MARPRCSREAFDPAQLREGAKSTGGIGGCPVAGFGSSPQRPSRLRLRQFAQQGWPEAQGGEARSNNECLRSRRSAIRKYRAKRARDNWHNSSFCRGPRVTAILPSLSAMSQSNAQLKDRVREFWQKNPCGTKFADAQPGSRAFYELVEQHRYEKEWHIPEAAGFNQTKDLCVLEVGCGLGTDGAQFAKAGAEYTGIDLTEAAVDLARRRFELFNLPGAFRVADAERLDFPANSFDL